MVNIVTVNNVVLYVLPFHVIIFNFHLHLKLLKKNLSHKKNQEIQPIITLIDSNGLFSS